MKSHLALHRKLLLLVAIPLSGAVIFSGIQLTRLLLERHRLGRIDATIDLARDIGALRQAVLAEQRDAADVVHDPGRVVVYRDHIGATDAAAARLRTRIAAADIPALGRDDVRDAIAAALAAHERLGESRTYFTRPDTARTFADIRAARGRYTEAYDRTLDALGLLALETDAADIRSRFEGLVDFGRIAAAAETERMLIDHGFTLQQITVATYNLVFNATSLRRYYESNLVLMAVPELAGYWNAFLADPVYARAAAMPALIYGETLPESRPFNQQHRAEWTRVSQDRNPLIDAVEPHLLNELHDLVASRQALATSRLTRLAWPAAALLLLSLAVAYVLVRRVERKLRAAHLGLATGVEAIARAVSAATEAAQRLADGASKEAAGLEQTGSALVALTSVNQKNVATAKQTVDQMTQTGALVGNSREAMQSLAETMNKIAESSNATFRIVKTINEIAFQTSILALNASIEAARAGAAGTGFAVVADEVRNLAKRAAEATAETGRLVDEARAAIETGTGLSDEVVAALRDVEANATKSGDLMSSIHSASEQMLQNMQHINSGNRSLETVTQQNAAIAQQNAAAAHAIAEETRQLQDTIGGLERLLVGARA